MGFVPAARGARETFKHGCICPKPKKDANGKYDWKIREDCQYHASAAAQPGNHGIPWNCPTYWDGCNCASSLSKQAEEIAALRADAERYRWIRQRGAWETEAFLNGLSPEQYDAAIDAAMADTPSTPATP